MTTAGNLECLKKAKVGDIAIVCMQPNGFDDEGRSRWKPSAALTDDLFSFTIIGIHPSTELPIIGVPVEDTTKYGFTKYGFTSTSSGPSYHVDAKKYSSSYILLARDIKTVKIYKT